MPTWRRILVPPTRSKRHAILPLIAGFVLEALTEIYQFVTTVRSVQTTTVGYYLSIVLTLVGFYLLWRGLHEWNQLSPRPKATKPRPFPWEPVSMFLGGIVAVALLDLLGGTLGGGDSPPLLAWVVGGVMVLAFGAFFLDLRRRAAPFQSPAQSMIGWAAFVWALGVSVVAGLALGQAIVGLFIDFFTNWPKLILDLAPFIFACAPLFVTFGLLSVGYALAYRHAPPGPTPPAEAAV